ncbi:nitroreductase [Olsenella sp. AM05-17]|jgi:nitroreductase|uniref:Nitroreductase family protein n=1 Tax=Tractidigestivibacter montrealensis TaxID=2972466 RepID=A0ABT1Z5N7_9ACTN|nr:MULTISPECIES: nitroreductase family protein [Atopobiaceae]MCR9035524.1 nitroreductase family protein [Tractidigestivibacter montrealensis]RHJ92196.1 nitroreductase [Olsenella sp. AM05-7]RHJ97198.1 nitroreductase [Olsenella sp. AM05-17]
MGRTYYDGKGDEMDYRMSIDEAVESRHAVRRYTEEPISAEERAALEEAVAAANADGALHLRLAYDDPEVFSSALARRAGFTNANNYLVVAGHESNNLDMRAGYFAEKVVLEAQRLGLNSCWVAGTAKRRAVRQTLAQKDKLVAIVALGHGATQGEPHRSRTIAQVSRPVSNVPEWFARGVRYALLAPTALNQQTFWVQMLRKTSADGLPLVGLSTNGGPCARVDLGIVKLHFELGAGMENFAWADPVVH